jgi:hypothetical protein
MQLDPVTTSASERTGDSSPSTRPRRRLRFSIKAVLVAMTALAVVFAWLGYQIRLARTHAREQAILAQWRAIGDLHNWGFSYFPHTQITTIAVSPKKVELTPEEERLLAPLVRLALRDSPASDAFLANLKHAKRLRFLELDRSGVTDAGLPHLVHVPALEELGLSQTAVTDAGLRHLSHLTQLHSLQLYKTKVTDQGLDSLSKLPRLRGLGLVDTQVTEHGINRFGSQRVSPNNGAAEFGPLNPSRRVILQPSRIPQ